MKSFLVVFASFIWILNNFTKTSLALPTIDPGVFVIQGVPTCRGGLGYCLLGTNCTMDKDFETDDKGGHCNEVTKSFSSMLSFVCCKVVKEKVQEDDVYVTTTSPVTVMEDKFQLLDENPIAVEISHDTEISEDEDIENLVDIIGLVTDSTGIISLVTRPYQPPVKSSTPPSVSDDVSPSMISSTSSSNSITTISSSTEVLNLSPTSSTSANDIKPKINIEVPTEQTTRKEEFIDEIGNSSDVKPPTEISELDPEETSKGDSPPSGESNSSSFDGNVSKVKIITTEPETSSYILSTSSEVITEGSKTNEENPIIEEEPLDKPLNTEVTTSNSITNSSSEISTNEEENVQTSNDKPKTDQTTTSTSSTTTFSTTTSPTTTETKDVSSMKNESFDQSKNSDSTDPITQNNSNTESFDTQDIINLISQTLMEKYSTTSSPSASEENFSKSVSTTIAETTTQTVADNSSIKNEGNKTTTSNEVPLSNHILNLPEEIRNYLNRKQAEKNSKKEKVTIPTTTSTSFTTTTMPSGYYAMMSTTMKESTDDIFYNYTTTTAFPQTKFVLKPAKLPNLQGTPLVPLVWTRTESESTTVPQRPSMMYTNEGFSPSTYRTTMLQKYEGPNVIQIQEKEEPSKKEPQDLVVPHPINLNICGLRTPSVMVKAILSEYARAASTYDWCWSAAVMRKEPGIDRFECSGTLIELDLVVTTAACIKRLRRTDLSNYRVVLGDSNLRDEMPYGVQYLDIAEIVAHPDYLTSGGAHANDIGVIRLREVATLDHNVCLACISQRNAHIPSHTCVVSGYTLGNVPHYLRRDVEGFSPIEGILRESLVKLQEPLECKSSVEKLSPNPLLVADPDSFLCDVRRKSARSCINSLDGGSPLVCEVGGRWFLTGIASWSRDCSSDPNIYTKVNSFSDWFLNTRLRMYGFITHRLL